ncbi:MAG: hypothetical protein QXN53_07595 [Thermoproteota archaeon]
MLNLDPFIWWIITISWSIAFLILVSIYIYQTSRTKRKERTRTTANRLRLVKDFVFVWILLGLLVFYIVSVNIGSAVLFAIGNIVVEIILIVYLMKNRHEKSEQTAVAPSAPAALTATGKKPIVPPGIREYHVPLEKETGKQAELTYQPMLIGGCTYTVLGAERRHLHDGGKSFHHSYQRKTSAY